jgi:hypothetical protein
MNRHNWHKENKPLVYNYYKGVCQICKQNIDKNLQKWDIHHLHYNINKTKLKTKLYETDFLSLINNNMIILICRPCHTTIHTVKDPNNIQILENSYFCQNCNKLEYGIINRKIHQKLDKYLCRKCFLLHKKININQLSLF